MSRWPRLFMSRSVRFAGSQYLPLAVGWAWQSLDGEADGLQPSPDFALGAVGGEYAAGSQMVVEGAEYRLAPHLGLFLGGEGVEVDHVVEPLDRGAGEVGVKFGAISTGRSHSQRCSRAKAGLCCGAMRAG